MTTTTTFPPFAPEYEPLLQAAWEAREDKPYCFQEALALLRKKNVKHKHYPIKVLFVYSLQVYAGLSSKSIAKIIGCPCRTIYYVGSRGERYLTPTLQEKGLAWAEVRRRHVAKAANFTLDKTINDLHARLTKLPEAEAAAIIREIRTKYIEPTAIN